MIIQSQLRIKFSIKCTKDSQTNTHTHIACKNNFILRILHINYNISVLTELSTDRQRLS